MARTPASRLRVGYASKISSKVNPSARFWKRTVTGMRVPANMGTPPKMSGSMEMLGAMTSLHFRWASLSLNPRSCRGTLGLGAKRKLFYLQSPRVRGKRQSSARLHLYQPTIPARTGPKPCSCGGTKTSGLSLVIDALQSPRVRGNLFHFPFQIQQLKGALSFAEFLLQLQQNSGLHFRVSGAPPLKRRCCILYKCSARASSGSPAASC